MLSTEQKQQFSDILEELGKTLDISKSQYDAAVKSYQAAGQHLSKEGSLLQPYDPEILPQGSFMIGTMIRPITDTDDLDIDLVCQLNGKNPIWTQYDLKQKVGDQLKSNDIYEKMLKEKRRCWKLEYANSANYHMDILPSIVDSDYRMILEKAFSAAELEEMDKLAIRITDNKETNYPTETDHLKWQKSNPFGYGRWFFENANLDILKSDWMLGAIEPVPVYQNEKLPLQRVIQILKRHRDMMFNGDEHKPISIIITTLAAKAYNKETNIIEALLNVIERMPDYIEERYSTEYGKVIKWVSNPVNDEENFADKWPDNRQKEENFYKWLTKVREDIQNALGKRGLHLIQESLENPFGKNMITKVFSNYGENLLKQRESGTLKMAAGTGILSSTGRANVSQHNPFGKNE